MPAQSCGHLSVPMAEPVIGSSSSDGTPVGFRLTRVTALWPGKKYASQQKSAVLAINNNKVNLTGFFKIHFSFKCYSASHALHKGLLTKLFICNHIFHKKHS